ncbi:hypothetical protein GGI03_005692 [Coemansia sp. RSA 2337]|nr:hypothetical protein GGI03_005692 [Coemansia sp. RSA 2337]
MALVARPPSWWTATVATVLQLAVFASILLFVIDSLAVSSTSSRILDRDMSVSSHATSQPSDPGGPVPSEQIFDVERALGDLAQITRTPHSLNDPRSIDVRDYLRSTIEDIISGSDAKFSDPLTNGTVAEFGSKRWLVYWEDSSLVVRVPGTGNHTEALLVQAHYDAVPMSHGAYDDGVGVVVCLELLRNLIQHPVRHPVLINIDWGEENGLFGAILFARFHQWAEDVRAYINLEAGGVGGRAMLFRASHPALLTAYKQAVQRPCASLVGNNAFKLGIVKSDTDYSIYTTRYGIPGLDLAFTDHRNLYHTSRDNAQQATPESVLSMGAATLSTARKIADSIVILPSLPRSPRLPAHPPPANTPLAGGMKQHVASDDIVKDAVFYDVLSRFMVVRSYAAEMWLSIATGLAGIAIVVALQYPFLRPLPASQVPVYASTLNLGSSRPMDRLVLQLGRGGFFGSLLEGLVHLFKSYLLGLFGSLLFTGILVSMVMPRLAYTHLFLFIMLLFSATALSATYGLSVWVGRSRLTDIHTMVWYSWCIMCSLVLLLLVAPLNAVEIGIFYRDLFYTWASIAAAVLTALMDPNTYLHALWRKQADRLVPRLSHSNADDDHRERLLRRDSSSNGEADDEDDDDNGVNSGERHIARHINQTQCLADNHPLVIGVMHLFASLRALFGVFLPLLIGMDTMLRQLVIFKDHLPDGSPPAACIAIAALDIATFVMFLAPYIVSAISDVDNFWPVHYIGLATTPLVQWAYSTWAQDTPVHRLSSTRPRSQISLHTNYARDRDSIDAESARSASRGEAAVHSTEYDTYTQEEDTGERVIVLDSGRRSIPRLADDNHNIDTAADREELGADDDDGLGRRPAHLVAARSGETPKTVGRRMVYAWAGIWLLLWVATQLVMLAGESYTEDSRPLKIRVSQSTRISAECLASKGVGGLCSQSKLALSSPDSAGLARVVNAASPDGVTHACYTRNTRDFYQCNLAYYTETGNSSGTWSPDTAINVTSVHHTAANVEHGTLFTVTLNFTAPETRTCFIDFGMHHGFSLQAYPNPRPVLPPADTASTLVPAISRTVLPVIERAGFIDGVSGSAAPITESFYNRDVIYSSRIYAHKRQFDSAGLFSAVIQYSVPIANASKPRGALVDISCYFDLVDSHVPLLASIISAAPKWATFTPAGNTLSTVTIAGVEV